MSALGHKQTCAPQKIMSALYPKADMCGALAHACFGPIADIIPQVPFRSSSKTRLALSRVCVTFGGWTRVQHDSTALLF